MTETRRYWGNGDPVGAMELLGETGTGHRATPESPIFTVVRVFTWDRGGYVLDIIGRSIKPEEDTDVHEVHYDPDAESLIDAAHTRHKITGELMLPKLRYHALGKAAEVDDDLDDALTKWEVDNGHRP